MKKRFFFFLASSHYLVEEVHTDEGNARKAKHVEQKQLVQVILAGVSKHYYCVGSFPIAAVPAVAVADNQRIVVLNPPISHLNNHLLLNSCL